ncbi:type II toxin-antitoxin system RelE/ParE family toxin [Sulfitobacter sp. S190]|uniref:type II toxin-antitoxin system RelE/ParE family toxin n=1 Tax=Sulfitobacter sp. S190 TaxID=2867022 RepID=UPI0021A574FC|nr:type II toxin-antitoxin system RelE/ParE family toxin [Sulfitobacter sp. S190]UWR24546.1 type II toxin-antitoxin system RelE/ParE family toxin [Sulfitobacter sp. S190]
MSLRLALRPRALGDLDEIWSFTEDRWGRAQAVSYLGGLDGVFTLLAQYPDMARLRVEFTPPLRLHPYRRHLILYRNEADVLEIIRVLHNRTDWQALLAD